jgi:hypothetical protein
MWLKPLLFGFTENLEFNAEYDTSEHVYEEIGPETHIMWKAWITE